MRNGPGGPDFRPARSLIHEHDIASVAVRALAGSGHAAAGYVLTGPEALTQEEQVRAIGEAIGRPLRYEEIPPQDALAQMLADGWPRPFAEHALGSWVTLADRPEPVTHAVAEIAGPHVPPVGRRPRRGFPPTGYPSMSWMNILDPGGAIFW